MDSSSPVGQPLLPSTSPPVRPRIWTCSPASGAAPCSPLARPWSALPASAAGRSGRIRDGETFCRLVVTGDENLLVDLALDSPPNPPPAASIAGPTFGLEELAGRKLLALFDRAEARDFADVFILARRYDVDLLLERAAQIDAGFDRAVLAAMLGSLGRFDDADIPIAGEDVAELRRFFLDWQQQLLAESSGDGRA